MDAALLKPAMRQRELSIPNPTRTKATEWALEQMRRTDPDWAERIEGAIIAMKRIQNESPL